jgi:hypothetical protein
MVKFKSTFDLIHIHFKKTNTCKICEYLIYCDIFDSVLTKNSMFYLKYK